MIKKLITAVAVLSFGVAFAETTVVTNGTTVTVTVGSDEEYVFPTRFDDAAVTKIVKEGAGTLNFGYVTNRFVGCNPEFVINAGIVKGIHGYNNVNGVGGSFGRTKSFTIAKDAQLYFLDKMDGSTANNAHVTTGYNATDGKGGTWVGAASVEVEGAGPDGTGAVRRPHAGENGGHDLFGVNKTIVLNGETVFASDSRWGIGNTTLKMNGHDLIVVGGNSLELGRSGARITFDGPVGDFVVSNSSTRILLEGASAFSYKNGATVPKIVLRNNAQLRNYNTTSQFPLEVSEGASATVYFGNSNTGIQVAPISILGPKLTTTAGNTAGKTVIRGGVSGNHLSFSGSNLGANTPITIDGDNAVDLSALTFSKPTPVQITNAWGVCVSGALTVQNANVTIANAATNRFGSITQSDNAVLFLSTPTNYIGSASLAAGTRTITGSLYNEIGSISQTGGTQTIADTQHNEIRSISHTGGTFVLTNAVRNTIGSLTAKSLGRYMTLADAGFVVLTNIVKGTSSNREVPAESAAALQMGGTGQNEGITRLDIKGQTVVTGVAGTNVNTVWGGCFSMAHLDTWDRDILSLSDGAVMTNNFYIGGSSQTRMGAIYLDGVGTELFAPGRKAPDSSTMTWLGRTSAYAYLGIDHGATFSHGGYLTVGQSGRGFVVLRDGTVRYGASDNSRTLKLAREGMGYAQYCQFGGTFTKGPWGTGPARIWMGYCDSIDQATGSTSVFTVDGRGQTSPTAEVEIIYGYAITNQAAGKASTSIVNIGRGATLSATRICRTIQGFDWNTYKGLNYKNSPMYVNFNGGTLKARQKGRIFEASDSGAVDPLRFPTRITVYEGGATIDTSGFDVTVNAPLLKPYGKGVKSVTLTDAESLTANTAIGARRVVITDSTGIGADVITDFDLSTRTTAPQSIVTSPGLGYSDSVVAKVESVKNYVVLSNATIEVEELATTGGFTKRGAGTLTMNATNTWGGATRIEAGTLALGTGGKLPDGGDLFVARDAILDLNGVDMEVANLDCSGRILDGSVKVNGTMTISGSDIAATGGQGPVIFGKVTFGPSARVVLTNPEAIKGLKGPIKLLTIAGGFDNFPEIEGLDTVLADKKLKLDVKDGEFRLRRRTGTFLILDSEKREIPPMPTLANRPVTAQAVIRCTGVTNTADLVGVRRDDGGVAFTVKLADLPANAFEVEIDASCAAYTYTGGASDTGWWMTNRGQVGDLNRQWLSNIVSNKRTYLPYFAMKTANDTFIAIVEGMRFEYELRIKSANYRYTAAPVWLVSKDKIGFDPYEDMTLVVYQLPMDDDYNEMAKLYRSYRFAHDPDVQFFKERAKGRTNLARLAQTIAVRQQHASKPSDVGNADDSKNKHNIDYTPETEPPVSCKHPFKESLRTLRLLKEAGVDDIFFKVTGWQSGGWDGRHPDVFPVAVEAGGEEGLRLFIRGAKAMGYMIDAHENYTDCYTCSRMWDNGNIACTDLNGNFDVNGYWAGGRAYNLCLENALKTFLPQQLRDVAALGFWGCHYVDVFAAVHPYRCCNPAHAASRQKQWENQKTIARMCRRLFGGFGSEACCDHMLGFVDYIHWVGEDINAWISNYNAEKEQNVDRIVPFYELAFHDVVLACADRYAYAAKVGTPANLLLIEYGGRPSFELNDPSRIPDVKAKYDEFKSLNCHWATEEMVEHKILVPNDNPDLPCGGFVRVTWGNGDKVYVNRTKSSQTADGVTVPANDYRVVRAP